ARIWSYYTTGNTVKLRRNRSFGYCLRVRLRFTGPLYFIYYSRFLSSRNRMEEDELVKVDYYTTLQLLSTATAAEIKFSYHRLGMKSKFLRCLADLVCFVAV